MRLKEWLDANGKKVSTISTAPQVAGTSGQITSGSFKKRLDKLITYYGQHLPSGIDYLYITLLTSDTLVFTEHYDTGSKAVCRIYISPTTEAWNFKVSVDSKPTDNLSGEGWTDLLKTLRAYITVPVTGTPEYKRLLTEWVDKSGKKVNHTTSSQSASTTSSNTFYKDKFKKLLDYHMAHSTALSMSIDKLSEDDAKASFSYVEEYEDVKGKVSESLIGVRYYKDTEAWSVKVYINGILVADKQGAGFNILIAELDIRMTLPPRNSTEYQDLCEWLDAKGNKVGSSSSQPASKPSSTTRGYWERFNKLIYYHVTHKSPAVDKIVRTKVSKDGFHYTEHIRAGTTGYEKDVVVNIDLATESWKFQIYVDGQPYTGGAGDDYVNLLKELRKHMNLPAEGTLDYDEILNESLSYADDFKLYENLWD